MNLILPKCWPFELTQVLQRGGGSTCSVWHHKAGHVWEPGQVDKWAEGTRRPVCVYHDRGQQDGPTVTAGRLHGGGEAAGRYWSLPTSHLQPLYPPSPLLPTLFTISSHTMFHDLIYFHLLFHLISFTEGRIELSLQVIIYLYTSLPHLYTPSHIFTPPFPPLPTHKIQSYDSLSLSSNEPTMPCLWECKLVGDGYYDYKVLHRFIFFPHSLHSPPPSQPLSPLLEFSVLFGKFKNR